MLIGVSLEVPCRLRAGLLAGNLSLGFLVMLFLGGLAMLIVLRMYE